MPCPGNLARVSEVMGLGEEQTMLIFEILIIPNYIINTGPYTHRLLQFLALIKEILV